MYSLLGLYALLGLVAAYGFLRTGTSVSPAAGHLKFSIIVCARNEEKNIGFCIKSLLAQRYPAGDFELILVDDDSYDRTYEIASQLLVKAPFRYKILRNQSRLGKKKSILGAMHEAQHDIIVSRDADTFTTSPTWLQSLANHYQQKGSDFVIGPLALANHSGLLWALQAVENNVLTVFSVGSAFYGRAFLCSGANLSYTRAIFKKSGAFASHLSIASGDDVLLLEDVKKINARVSYLKSPDAIVLTYPCLSFKELLQQKIRWASKFKNNPNFFNGFFAILVFIVNLGTLASIVALPFVEQKLHLQLLVLLKLLIDILLLFLASTFIKNKNLLWYALPVAFVYPVYACVVALASLFVKPQWK